jgi:hypothetical protein
MPIEVTWSTASGTRSPLANARILRLAFGTALSLWISQAVGWSISYMAPVLTMFLLVVMALAVSVYGTFIFLPLLLHQKAAGFLLLSLALFHSFYFTARGGKAVIGTLVTVGLALTVAVGTVSVDALLAVAQGLMIGAAVGTSVAVLSHVFIRDPAPDPSAELQSACAAFAGHSRSHHPVVLVVRQQRGQYGGNDKSGRHGAGSFEKEHAGCGEVTDNFDTCRWCCSRHRLAGPEHLAFADALCVADRPCGPDLWAAHL